MNIATRMGVGFGTLLTLFVTLASVVLFNVAEVNRQFSDVIQHDAPVIANAQELLTLVVDLETGQRGYVITGNDEFLEPYQRGGVEFNALLRTEKELVSDNTPQVIRLDNIERLVQEWKQNAAEPEISMRRSILEAQQRQVDLQSVLAAGVGKGILDEIRETVGTMVAAFILDGNIQGVNLLNFMLKDMVDQETGERGFLITGEEEFLDPFKAGQVSLKSNIQTLRTLILNAHDREATDNDLVALSALHAAWVRSAAEPEIALRRQVNAGEKSSPTSKQRLEERLGSPPWIRCVESRIACWFDLSEPTTTNLLCCCSLPRRRSSIRKPDNEVFC